MEHNIKSFLGKRPVRITGQLDRSKKEEYAIRSANSALMTQNKYGALPELNITQAGNLRLIDPTIYVDKTTIFTPLRLSLSMTLFVEKDKTKPALYTPKTVFFIKGLASKPDIDFLLRDFSKLLSSPYPGTLDNITGRYAIILSNARDYFLKTLLLLAVKGDGSVIDYSWIAPLQEIVADKEEEILKLSRSKKPNLYGNVDIDDEISVGPIHDFGTPEPSRRAAQKAALNTTLDEIKKRGFRTTFIS